MRHDLLAAQHERRPRNAPTHRMEHRHDAADGIGTCQTHRIGHTLRQGMQILGSMLVLNTLRVAGSTTGVAQAQRRIFVDLRPFIVCGFAGDKGFIVNWVG